MVDEIGIVFGMFVNLVGGNMGNMVMVLKFIFFFGGDFVGMEMLSGNFILDFKM